MQQQLLDRNKQGNRHPRARRTGVVPAGVNHRAPDQGQPSARRAASRLGQPLARGAASRLSGLWPIWVRLTCRSPVIPPLNPSSKILPAELSGLQEWGTNRLLYSFWVTLSISSFVSCNLTNFYSTKEGKKSRARPGGYLQCKLKISLQSKFQPNRTSGYRDKAILFKI